jgi:uncharacterized SAM-binding protein YcdF (DUF218 family)
VWRNAHKKLPMKQFRRRLAKFWWVGLAGLLSVIPVRLAIAQAQAPRPQAVLVLGGEPAREQAAAQLARAYPDLEVWVSTGEPVEKSEAIFRAAQVDRQRVHLDFQATDTVTNFTTLIPAFQQRRIQHVYLVTADFHMPRAKAIATLVLGSQGITFTPVATPSDRPPETQMRTLRDSGRSLLWIFTGRTGASLEEREELQFLNR